MANREACEVYIEQEIKEGLEQGKKPYSIGKEIAAWVEKVFEVNIKPKTIEKRAERIREDFPTNVGKESQPAETIQNTTPEIIKDRHPQGGGKREGAGRRKKFRPHFPRYIEAMKGAHFAINMLKLIPKKDPNRDRELTNVLNWIMENRKGEQYEK